MRVIPIVLGCLLAQACMQHKEPEHRVSPVLLQESKKKIEINLSTFSSTIDPVCEMDLKYALEDTLSINGKLYGFCSSGCKQQYLAGLRSDKK